MRTEVNEGHKWKSLPCWSKIHHRRPSTTPRPFWLPGCAATSRDFWSQRLRVRRTVHVDDNLRDNKLWFVVHKSVIPWKQDPFCGLIGCEIKKKCLYCPLKYLQKKCEQKHITLHIIQFQFRCSCTTTLINIYFLCETCSKSCTLLWHKFIRWVESILCLENTRFDVLAHLFFSPSVAINTTHVMNSLMHRGDWHRMSSDQTQWVSHDGGMFNEWFAENTRWCHFPPCCYCEATTPNSPHGECDFHGLVSLSSYVYPTGGVFYDKMTFCD